MSMGSKRPRSFASTYLPSQPGSAFLCTTIVVALFLFTSLFLKTTPSAGIPTAGSFAFSHEQNAQAVSPPSLSPQDQTTQTVPNAVSPPIAKHHWVTTWTAGPQSCLNSTALPDGFYEEDVLLHNVTIRQTVRLTLGGDEIRVQLSNFASRYSLRIDEATVARPAPEVVAGEETLAGSPGIEPATVQTLTFGDQPYTTIPPGGLVLSDPIKISVENGGIVTISLFLAEGQQGDVVTCHMASKTHSWLINGNHSEATTFSRSSSEHMTSWYYISAVEAWKPSDYGAVVIFGDSITDASRAPVNSNARWTDHVFDRMQNSTSSGLKKLSILNQAIGGNQLLEDRTSLNLNARLARDGLSISGVKFAVIVEGVIDIAAGRDHQEVFFQFKQAVTRFHAASIPVIGATLKPFSCEDGESPWIGANSPLSEQERLKLNTLIRNEEPFDTIIDFDAILRDPKNVTETNPLYTGPDCLHPSTAGYDAIVRRFPIDAFETFLDKVSIDGPVT